MCDLALKDAEWGRRAVQKYCTPFFPGWDEKDHEPQVVDTLDDTRTWHLQDVIQRCYKFKLFRSLKCCLAWVKHVPVFFSSRVTAGRCPVEQRKQLIFAWVVMTHRLAELAAFRFVPLCSWLAAASFLCTHHSSLYTKTSLNYTVRTAQ